MKILVAGGAGFLGAHLCDRLVRSGHHVVCLDNYHTGRPEAVTGLVEVARACGGDLEILTHDVIEPLPAAAVAGVERIYNLACPASPVHYQRAPLRTLETCVLGARNVLRAAADTGARVLQASTSEIYGEPHVHPQHEGYWGNVNPIGPRACYDEGKRAAEALCADYQRALGVAVRIARIFNTYGPGMQQEDGRVVSTFVVRALRGEALPVCGDGTQTRAFCYVTDMVEGLCALMESDVEDGPVNLGNPRELSIAELGALINELTGNRAGFEHLPPRVDDPTRRLPDIRRARELLGWEPRTGIRDGLIPTVEFFRARALP